VGPKALTPKMLANDITKTNKHIAVDHRRFATNLSTNNKAIKKAVKTTAQVNANIGILFLLIYEFSK